ncbi:MAG: hypothetical protein P8H59_06855 [Flavobacteriales bacterium]|nr:hypothetical protein [Flavobacteriales bacterium]MDG1780651.1 hypothetical protein [Flavobacteriales bacterium]MDG2246476.1 hypothetical protein [Flavobacteriales bacterium]
MQGNKNITSKLVPLLVVILCFLFSGLSFGQDNVLLAYGSIKNSETKKKMDGIEIVVLKDGSPFDDFVTTGSGKYEFELPLGHDYIISYSKEGFVPKKLQVNTKGIPAEDMEGGFQMNLEVTIFEYIEGFDLSIVESPVGKANFSAQQNSIDWDMNYTGRMMSKIEDELERLAKLGDELEKMREEFNELVQKGDQKMTEEKFSDAISKYEAALELFDEEPVQTKLAEAQAAYDAANADKEREANYQRLLAQAKNDIKKEKFESAQTALNEAIELKSEEREPRDLLDKIAKQLEEIQKRKDYDAIVADADSDFQNEDYAVSIEKYNQALDLFGNEEYPRDQIREAQRIIDEKLAAELAGAELEQKYQDAIALGEKNMKNAEYQAALRNFEEASTLKKEERLPKDKIEEIEGILADLAAQEDADRAANEANAEAERINAEYQALITSADQKFESENLEAAKTDYQAALDLKNQEKYPKSRIARIDDLLAEASALADNSAAEAAAQREADRLAAEEADRLAREAKEEQKAQDRERREAEEQAERERLAAEKAAREEEERRRNENFANSASASAEDDAERYYREARESEERAKKKAIEQKKEDHEKFLANEDADSKQRREEYAEGLDKKEDALERIYRDGEMNRSTKQIASDKKKEDYSSDLAEYSGDASMRREDNNAEAVKKGEEYRAIDKNDVYRQSKVDESERDQERYVENATSYDAKGNSLRKGNEYEVNRSKEKERDQMGEGEQVRLENQNDSEYKKKQYAEYSGDLQAAASERLDSYEDDTNDKKRAYADVSKGKEVYREENAYDVNKEKENNAYLLADKSEEAKLKGYDSRKEAFAKQAGEPRDAEDYFLPEGGEDLSEGVQERSYEEGNKMVIERIVKRGNIVNTYRKIISKTGIYYFKDGRSITESSWKRETLNVKD